MPRTALVLWLGLMLVASRATADGRPLFASDEILTLRIDAAMHTIVRRADDRPVVDGVLNYTDSAGQDVTIPVTMTTRGKSRLAYCSFPPLSITMKRKQARGTLFDGQKKLKIVTHCKNGSTHERYLLQEHGIYRAFNVLTDHSFRVRKLELTYGDTDGKRKDETHAAFFIERDNDVAARLGMETLKVSQNKPEQLDGEHANLFSLFQFLIANTDWSMIKGPGDEGCCHNGKVIIPPGSESGWMVLPYDFDQAGIIHTKYSMPANGLGLKSVRQRLYRGRCLNIGYLDANIARVNEHRTALEEALVPPVMKGGTRSSAMKYIDNFYKIVNDPKKRQQQIVDDCLGKKP